MYAAQQSPLYLPGMTGLSNFLTHSCNQSRLVLLKRQQYSALHDEAGSLVYVWLAVQEQSHPIWLAKMHWLRKPATCQQACMLLPLLLLSQMLLQPLIRAHPVGSRHLNQSALGEWHSSHCLVAIGGTAALSIIRLTCLESAFEPEANHDVL